MSIAAASGASFSGSQRALSGEPAGAGGVRTPDGLAAGCIASAGLMGRIASQEHPQEQSGAGDGMAGHDAGARPLDPQCRFL